MVLSHDHSPGQALHNDRNIANTLWWVKEPFGGTMGLWDAGLRGRQEMSSRNTHPEVAWSRAQAAQGAGVSGQALQGSSAAAQAAPWAC